MNHSDLEFHDNFKIHSLYTLFFITISIVSPKIKPFQMQTFPGMSHYKTIQSFYLILAQVLCPQSISLHDGFSFFHTYYPGIFLGILYVCLFLVTIFFNFQIEAFWIHLNSNCSPQMLCLLEQAKIQCKNTQNTNESASQSSTAF